MPTQDEPQDEPGEWDEPRIEIWPLDSATTQGDAPAGGRGGDAGPYDPTVEAPEPTEPEPTGPARDQTIDYTGAAPDPERVLGGRFRLITMLKRQGNLGEVHEAEDLELGRRVVVKLIGSRIAAHPDAQARFLREAAITSQLEHSGVAPVFGYGVTPRGRLWYAMRFVQGETLADAIGEFNRAHPPEERLSAEGRLVLRSMLRRFLTVCGTIAYAHGRGVIHRDIKPGNIMFGAREGDTVVLDWGLGKPLDAPLISVGPWSGSGSGAGSGEDPGGRSGGPVGVGSGSTETVAGAQVGTLRYMAPQQVDREPATYPSDIYSLGATLYHIVAGVPPFSEYMAQELEGYIRRGEFRPPRAIRPALDRELEAIVLKAMRHEPSGRYATAAELADELERWAADEPISALRAPWPTRARRWARRHRTLGAAGAVLLLALAGASVPLAVLYERAGANAAEARRQGRLASENEDRMRRLLEGILEVLVQDLPRLPGNEGTSRLLIREALDVAGELKAIHPTGGEARSMVAQTYASAARVVSRHERVDVPDQPGRPLPGPGELFDLAIAEYRALLPQAGPEAGPRAEEAARLEVERSAWQAATRPLEAALADWAATWDRLEALRRDHPGAAGVGRAMGRALALRAQLLADGDDTAAAKAAAEQAVELLAGPLDDGDRAARVEAMVLLGRLAADAQDRQAARDWLGRAEEGAQGWRAADQDNPAALASWAGVSLAVLELKVWGGLPAPRQPADLQQAVRELGLAIQDLRNGYPETAAFSRLMASYALIYPRLLADPRANSGALQPDQALQNCIDEALGRLEGPLPGMADHRLVVRMLCLLRARALRSGQAVLADRHGLEARRRVGRALALDPRRFSGLKEIYERDSDPLQGLWR